MSNENAAKAILPLLDRAEALLASGAGGARAVQSLALARHAYQLWQQAPRGEEAGRWISMLCSKALAAALDARGTAGTSVLFELAGVAAAAEGHHLRELADGQHDFAKAPPPPPLIGRLASAPAAEPPTERAAPTEPSSPPGPPPIDDYGVARCAAIAASIARRRSERSSILERNQLEPATWAALELHWADAIRHETQHGKTALLTAYDDAYVAQLELERGPVTVAEYARLAIASEWGSEEETAAALDVPRAATPRIQRVWLRKTARDKALGKQVRQALDRRES